jgi:hypothetical protein
MLVCQVIQEDKCAGWSGKKTAHWLADKEVVLTLLNQGGFPIIQLRW